MPFWSKEKWTKLTSKQKPIHPWNADRLDAADYRLSIGDEVYISEGDGSKIQQLNENESFAIAPGQFAFIITEEEIILPLNVIGFISVRAGTKFFGLINVSGFHVDPGYSGKLIFAVFNSGPTRINLRRGDDIFSIWLADVTHKAKERKHGYYHIPSKLVNQIDGRHQTAYQLNEKIEKVERELFYTKIVAALAALLLVFPAAKDLISNGSLDLISNEEVVQDAVEMETTGAAGTTGAVVPSHQLNGESK